MVSSRLKRFTVSAVVLIALCGLAAGSAFAGVLGNNPTIFAHEIATSATNLAFAGQVYTMGIARNVGQNFILRYNLSSGVFGTGALALVDSVPANTTIVLRSGGIGSNQVEFDINVVAAGGTAIGETFTLTGTVRFPAGSAVGSAINITVDVRDVIGVLDNVPGPFTRTLATLGAAATMTAATDNGTVINATVLPPLTQFVVANDDTALVATATVTTTKTVLTVRDATGLADYVLLAGDLVTFTITGDFSGINQVAFDLNADAVITVGGGTAANEVFTVVGNTATLTVNGDRLGTAATTIHFTKAAAAVLSPRTFGIAATIAPAAGVSQNRSVATANATWFVWTQNGTTLLSPYITFSPGNSTKFRFTNSTNVAITILIAVVVDQGTITQNVAQVVVPAGGSQQITLSDVPAAGTGELGPIATLNTGTQPVRGKATFTALTETNNVSGTMLVASPVGVITIDAMRQIPPLH